MSRTLAPISGDTLPAIRRLWREWMRPHRGELAAVAGLVVLVAGTTGLYPVLIKAAFDAFSAKDERAIMLAPLFVVVGHGGQGLLAPRPHGPDQPRRDPHRGRHADGPLCASDRRRSRPARAREPGRADAALHDRFRLHQGSVDAALDRVPARGRDHPGADRRDAVDRPGPDPRRGAGRTFHRPSDRAARPEAEAGRDPYAGTGRRDGEPDLGKPRRRSRRQDLRPRRLSEGPGRRPRSTRSGGSR